MASSWHRFQIDRRMRRQPVLSIADIVEAYCVLKTTSTGRVPTVRTIELVRRKVAEAAAEHRLAGDDLVVEEPASPRRRRGPVGPHPEPSLSVVYLVAVGDAIDSLADADDVTVIRRLPEALLASVPRDRARRLREAPYVHVFDRADVAMAAFQLFDRP
jgi:hypothetical protein